MIKLKKACIACITVCTIFAMASCKSHMGSFTIMTTRPVDFAQLKNAKKVPERKGENLAFWFGIFPVVSTSIQGAVEDAISKVPGGIALIDGSMYSYLLYAVLVIRSGYIVEGTVLVDARNAQAPTGGRMSDYMVSMPETETGEVRLFYLNKEDHFRAKEELRLKNVKKAKSIILAGKLN